MCSSLGSSDSVAGHLVTLKFYKNNIKIIIKYVNFNIIAMSDPSPIYMPAAG